MKNKINKFLLVLFLVICSVMVSLAQPVLTPPDPLGSPGTPTPMNSTASPIPDGVIVLLVLAIIYGVYKYLQLKKQVKAA